MKKSYLALAAILTTTLCSTLFTTAPVSAETIGWKNCYHTDLATGKTARLGFIYLWETCEGSSKIMDKIHEQHSTGIVRDKYGTESYVSELMHRVDDPNCVIDTNTHTEPDY